MKIKNIILLICLFCMQNGMAQQKLNVVIAGLSHDHVNRMLAKHNAGEITIVGIVEANAQLANQKKTAYQLADALFYNNLNSALKKLKPDMVMLYNAPVEHLASIEICMPLHIPVMVEKPLCFSYADAKKIEQLSQQFNTKVFTNYPSAWYTSFMELVKKANDVGPINKMIMQGGHRGPVEIGCSPAFIDWLTSPEKNGGGALIDFGCYGASIMTELMKGAKPVAVYATARQLKPAVYPTVADDATIILEYANNCTGIIEASWGWPFTMMNAEVYCSAVNLKATQFKQNAEAPALQYTNEQVTRTETLSVPKYKDEVAYLTDVIKNGAPDNIDLLSLRSNMVVVQILDAASKSVQSGKKIVL